MKKIMMWLLVCGMLSALCGCAAEASSAPRELAGWDEDFLSSGGVHVTIADANADPVPAAMPVLRVRPRTITASMARRMAEALFGDAVLYEHSEEMSKAEIARMIDVYENALSDEEIRSDHGEGLRQEFVESARRSRLELLEFYRNAYALARDEIEPAPCQWAFWPEEHYVMHDYAGTDQGYTEDIPFGLHVMLWASTVSDGVPYAMMVHNNETSSFRAHGLSVFLDEPRGLRANAADEDGTAASARLAAWYGAFGAYAAERATEEQLSAARDKAVRLAQEMGLGEWRFTAEVRDESALPWGGYQIALEGEPVYEGFPVSAQLQLENMRSTAPGAQNYYYESLTMTFSNEGLLVGLDYTSPLEVVEVVEPSVPLLTEERVRELALDTMRGWTRESVIPGYDPTGMWWSMAAISECEAAVDSVHVGFARIVYDSTDFLLVPAITFRGIPSAWGTLEGMSEPMDLLMLDRGYHDSLLVLDLRDGTPIQVKNLP